MSTPNLPQGLRRDLDSAVMRIWTAHPDQRMLVLSDEGRVLFAKHPTARDLHHPHGLAVDSALRRAARGSRHTTFWLAVIADDLARNGGRVPDREVPL